MDGRLRNMTGLITGCGSGIGRATALRFGREGCAVAVNDVNLEGAQAVADGIRSAGGRALAVRADISVAGDVERMVRAVIEEFGRVDILINNAGVISRMPLDATSDEEWARALAIDLTGVFLCSRAVVSYMKATGGVIVSIASIAAMRGTVSAAYTAAKGGVIALTRELAGEVAAHGIRVNCVSPGFIATPLNAAVRARGLDKLMVSRIPLRRLGTPDEIASACVFLASDEASYITGTNLVVDGGATSVLDVGDEFRMFEKKHAETDG